MRTLDEVIEIASDWTNGFDEMSIEKQMLHYLKEYRSDKMEWEAYLKYCQGFVDSYIKSRDKHQAAVIELKHKEKKVNEILTDYVALMQYRAEQQENPPLTWDELKAMEGKPLWVEYNFRIDDKDFRDKSKRWCIVREFKPWHNTEIIITENGFVLSKNEQIKDWQAYRKERK